MFQLQTDYKANHGGTYPPQTAAEQGQKFRDGIHDLMRKLYTPLEHRTKDRGQGVYKIQQGSGMKIGIGNGCQHGAAVGAVLAKGAAAHGDDQNGGMEPSGRLLDNW